MALSGANFPSSQFKIKLWMHGHKCTENLLFHIQIDNRKLNIRVYVAYF